MSMYLGLNQKIRDPKPAFKTIHPNCVRTLPKFMLIVKNIFSQTLKRQNKSLLISYRNARVKVVKNISAGALSWTVQNFALRDRFEAFGKNFFSLFKILAFFCLVQS